MPQLAIIKRLTLSRVRDIALVAMAVCIIGVCVTLGVMLLTLYPSVQASVSNLERASESAVVAADNLVTASRDIAAVAANMKAASESIATAFARVEEASEGVAGVVDNITTASEELKAASDSLVAQADAALAGIGELPGLFGTGN